ncbi:SDR family NAD(P)-dependent oxidoreductase [Pontibacter silvestris]|uniref:SDR family NAD(P)-dependent oxidoreductase n=1 Tax=Pontibacter silvestris TaxID=2305183 RepID=A0ABW4X005_9BACT|nr:SDR family oxidoreductase [Pontibacter silvestris]MCC9135385.1 SDR family oxidoreductase [Pontibacter silvestris]
MKKNKKGAGKTVLITGASNGFGMEFAKLFAKDGYNLVLVARTEERLKALGYGLQDKYKLEKVCIVTSDLSKPESPQEIYDEVKKAGITVDVLVNNAGAGSYGFFHEKSMQSDLDLMQLNIISLVQLTKLFVYDMRRRNEGKILNLGSLFSIMPSPLMATYGASKAFVLSFSEALAEELKHTNVTVTALCPNAGNTLFFKRAGAEKTLAANGMLYEPEEVAKAGYKGMMKGELKVIVGAISKLEALSTNIMPDAAVAATSRYLMKEVTKNERVMK